MTINMSYCRFQNTLLAVKECSGDLGDMIEGRGEPLSREERNACVELAREAFEFLQMLETNAPDGLTDDDDRLADFDLCDEGIQQAITTICETAGSECDDDEQ